MAPLSITQKNSGLFLKVKFLPPDAVCVVGVLIDRCPLLTECGVVGPVVLVSEEFEVHSVVGVVVV